MEKDKTALLAVGESDFERLVAVKISSHNCVSTLTSVNPTFASIDSSSSRRKARYVTGYLVTR